MAIGMGIGNRTGMGMGGSWKGGEGDGRFSGERTHFLNF